MYNPLLQPLVKVYRCLRMLLCEILNRSPAILRELKESFICFTGVLGLLPNRLGFRLVCFDESFLKQLCWTRWGFLWDRCSLRGREDLLW